MKEKKETVTSRFWAKIQSLADYCVSGVWKDTRNSAKVRIIKVVNLSVRTFFDRDLQTRAMSLTYSTVLAIVPVLALIFAIGRGFGLQSLIEDALYKNFPGQHKFISMSLQFADSYLKEASEGVIVGIGIIFLLWTLFSLLSYIETAFNQIWDIKRQRTFYQKFTDYVAICLLVPILMICSSGVSIFMSATVSNNLHFAFLSPVLNVVLEAVPFVLAWLAFTFSFQLIPNTKVNFKYSAISGAICAILFSVLQILFVNGQIYVSKYNAIYGSFAFLPLFLIWLQLSWLIVLLGAVLTNSMQNVLGYFYIGDINGISHIYRQKIAIIVAAVIGKRFSDANPPLTRFQISTLYDIPIRITNHICELLNRAGLVNYVYMADDKIGVTPAFVPGHLTIGDFLKKIDNVGPSDFIPDFEDHYRDTLSQIDSILSKSYGTLNDVRISDIEVKAVSSNEDMNIDNSSSPTVMPEGV